MSSVLSELRDWCQTKCNFLKVFMLYTFGSRALNGLLHILCLCTSQKLLKGLYFSQLPAFSLLKFQNILQLFHKSKILRIEVFLWYWLSSGTELCGRAENIFDRYHLHIRYLHQQYAWPLESVFSWYFAAYWTERKTQQKADLLLLLFWWCVCERARILKPDTFSVFVNVSLQTILKIIVAQTMIFTSKLSELICVSLPKVVFTSWWTKYTGNYSKSKS